MFHVEVKVAVRDWGKSGNPNSGRHGNLVVDVGVSSCRFEFWLMVVARLG